jgi:hypothetical protein
MRARWAATLTAVLTAALVTAAGAAWATDPVELSSGYVFDQAGALSDAEAGAAQAELADLYTDSGADLYVVFVDEFTNPSSSEEWANTVAQDNGLGPSQYLLAVATEGRQYYLSADSSGPLSEEEVAAIEADVRPYLSDSDYAGAITAAADSMRSALGAGGGAAGDDGFPSGILILVIIAAAIGVVIWLIVRSRRNKGPVTGGPGGPAVEQVPLAELERRAASALVETDDALKTSAQELAFAKAQFGDAATVEFEQALAQAQTNLDEAFTLQQQLDDATPDSEQDARAWNERIIALCEQANTSLDEKAEAFDELRKLEQNAPEALTRVETEKAKAEASLEGAAARLQTLRSSYAPEALATIADNPDQARARLAFAAEQLAAAQAAIGAGKGGEAAVGIRAAEEAVGQAVLLENAIGKLADDLAQGEQSAAALIAELEQDIAGARALPDPDGRIAGVIAATTQQIEAARANLSGPAKRPLVTLQSLEAANQQIDALVQGIRDAAAQAQRARQMVGQLILQAQAQVSTAEDYITARRGAVGAEARTRLAEAGAALVRAQQLQASDPEQAMQHAQRADQLAGQAIQSAQGDVGAFPGGGGMFGGPSQGGGDGGGMLGAVLGGILINSMMGGGGGRSSGGLGGGLGGLGGMLGGSSGGGIRPGSFGGGGTRGRRGGGRF